MMNELGEPVVGPVWMSDSGSGSLGGGSGGANGQPDGGSPGSPSQAGEGGVDTPGPGGGGAADVGTAPGQESAQAPPPQRETPDWRDKRIATLTRRLRELQEQQGQPPVRQPSAPEGPTGLTQNDIDRLAEQKAQSLAAIHEFNRRCDEVAMAGRQAFGDNRFNERIGQLQKLVDVNDPQSVQTYNMFLTAAIDTGEASKLLYALGADLDEAQRIMGMSPTRMAAELTRKAMAVDNGTTQVSGAPRPLTPIGGRGASHELISPDDPDRADHLGTTEWMRRREAQIAERMRARNAR